MDFIESKLKKLRSKGNFRRIPCQDENLIDFSSNDYLGIAANEKLRHEFLGKVDLPLSSSASRLLSKHQQPFRSLENVLEEAYGGNRRALLFNSGYHANVGIISALGKDVVIIADKLVHASIIDGIRLGAGQYVRFAHNDMSALERQLQKCSDLGKPMLIIVESVYSMDGDVAPLNEIAELKKRFPNTYLYVDEAHAVGVNGPNGLGLAKDIGADIIIGTFGKALASQGAFAVTTNSMRDYLVNHARSLIFSTAIPPLNVAWSEFTFRRAMEMDDERRKLAVLSFKLSVILGNTHTGHIQPLIVGDAEKALILSARLKSRGISALAIRTPTVPPGTERIRFSLCAALNEADLEKLNEALYQLKVL